MVPPGLLALADLHPSKINIVCSPKTKKVSAALVPYVSTWKYVIRAGEQAEDGLPMMSTQRPGKESRLFRPPDYCNAVVLLQPMDEQDEERNEANLYAVRDAALKHGYRAGIQLHKLMRVD